jgi:hypothetical protein
MEPVILEGFDVEPDSGELTRLLGRKGGGRGDALEDRTAGKISGALSAALEESKRLISPRAVYVIASGSGLALFGPAGSDIFNRLERVAFCVCTIGQALEEKVTELSKSGDLLAAVVLDAVGSASAEAVAQYANDRIDEEAATEGLKTSCRASPGYGDWDVGGQKALFGLVPAGRIGVTLTEGCMMIPRKSVSFAVHIAAEPVRLRSENSCRNCHLDDCPYRFLE